MALGRPATYVVALVASFACRAALRWLRHASVLANYFIARSTAHKAFACLNSCVYFFADHELLADTRGGVARLLTTNFRANKDVSGPDRGYLKVVATRTGLTPPDAQKRVNDVVTQIKADLDKARKAAMHAAIWLTLSLFIGAFAAAAAAWEGGGVRDRTWGKITTIRGTVARSP